jgi:hypothetical protein
MKTWNVASEFDGRRCGGCDRAIAAHEPYLALTIAGMRRALVRCVTCATDYDAGAPPATPTPTGGAPTPMLPIRALARPLAVDWKERQIAREREDVA